MIEEKTPTAQNGKHRGEFHPATVLLLWAEESALDLFPFLYLRYKLTYLSCDINTWIYLYLHKSSFMSEKKHVRHNWKILYLHTTKTFELHEVNIERNERRNIFLVIFSITTLSRIAALGCCSRMLGELETDFFKLQNWIHVELTKGRKEANLEEHCELP